MHIAHAFTNTPPVTVASGMHLYPARFIHRSPPHYCCCYSGDAFAAWTLLAVVSFAPRSFRRTGDAWACGYGWENAMAPQAMA